MYFVHYPTGGYNGSKEERRSVAGEAQALSYHTIIIRIGEYDV